MAYGAYEAEFVKEMDGIGKIYRIALPLDGQLKTFLKKGISSLAAPDEIAKIRLANISYDFSRTSMAALAMKDRDTILVRNSPLMNPDIASEAVKAHLREEYFATGKEFYEEARARALEEVKRGIEPEKRTAIFVSHRGDFSLNSFMDEARFIFREQNIPYSNKFFSFCNLTGEYEDKATLNHVAIDSIQHFSRINCRGRDLDEYFNAFAILKN